MLKKTFFAIATFLISITFFACNVTPNSFWSGDNNVNARFQGLKNLSEIDDEIKKWNNDGKNQYKILVIADVHKGAKYYKSSIDEKFSKWLNSLDSDYLANIKFALGLGDFANSGEEDEMQEYAELVSKIQAKGIKVLNVIGNHELFEEDGYEIYAKYCYPNTSYYKFYTNNFVWYGLDSGSGTLGSRQLADLRENMSRETKIPVVFTHVPLAKTGLGPGFMPYCFRDTTERNILVDLFSEKRIAGYFCGHYHPGGIEEFGNFTQYNFKSFGQFGKWYVVDVDENKAELNLTEFE